MYFQLPLPPNDNRVWGGLPLGHFSMIYNFSLIVSAVFCRYLTQRKTRIGIVLLQTERLKCFTIGV